MIFCLAFIMKGLKNGTKSSRILKISCANGLFNVIIWGFIMKF